MQWGPKNILQIKRTIPIPNGPAIVMDRGAAEALYLANLKK